MLVLEVGITAEYFAGMTSGEYGQLLNLFGGDFNLIGEAGSLEPFAELTLLNTDTAESRSLMARSDRSFGALIPAESGDTIEITSLFGTDKTVIVP